MPGVQYIGGEDEEEADARGSDLVTPMAADWTAEPGSGTAGLASGADCRAEFLVHSGSEFLEWWPFQFSCCCCDACPMTKYRAFSVPFPPIRRFDVGNGEDYPLEGG